MIVKYIGTIICAAIFAALIPVQAAAADISFSVPDSAALTGEELAGHFTDVRASRFRGDYEIQVVVYYFSPGVEVFTYSGSGEMGLSFEKGVIKALVKIKKAGKLSNVKFISAEGSDRKEILDNFALELLKNI